MTRYLQIGGCSFAESLHRFIEGDVLPGTGVDSAGFWSGFAELISSLAPLNRRLLARRDELQMRIDQWHREHSASDRQAYRRFLEQIGYLVAEGAEFRIDTAHVDREISALAAPQLIVPLSNPRFALNAANARWGSLYDALYGTDAMNGVAPPAPNRPYDEQRGRAVMRFVRGWLDRTFPLANGSHEDAVHYVVDSGYLRVALKDGSRASLQDNAQFRGYEGSPEQPRNVLLVHHGLHIELQIDRTHPVGRTDPAGVADVLIEAALTTIVDCEDAVAAVDADDKIAIYRNWLGLMRGTLQASFAKDGRVLHRTLAPDRKYMGTDGATLLLPGRSLMFIRNVGLLMTTELVRLADGSQAPEGLIDGVVTSLIAMHDLRGNSHVRNSVERSIYIVKPKMHGPAEVAFVDEAFDKIEGLLGLPRHTIKVGLMDEERRTSANLKECIRAARHRVVFVNTGFLDRTGDEIHTSMRAGPMLRKEQMKSSAWLQAYEQRSVAIALACGFAGRAQIGKGMWAMPDRMADMLENKIAHPRAGASTAWVPSPTVATLHALHYHAVDVAQRQRELQGSAPAGLAELLEIPLAAGATWTQGEIDDELDGNLQAILGYVVRWIDRGIGCSKVPDKRQIGLMEDRATLRISSQLVANWLMHGVCARDQVLQSLRRMADVVDGQNRHDPGYRPLGPSYEGIAFQAACDLVFEGAGQPNGYTEPLLHAHRAEFKRRARIP